MAQRGQTRRTTKRKNGCQPAQRSDEQVEPVGYHSKPLALYDELDHSYSIKAWIDLTALDKSMALMCILKRKPYFGFTLTDYHLAELRKRLVKCTLAEFRNANSPLHQPEFSSAAGSQESIAGLRPRPDAANAGNAPKRRKRTPQSVDAKKAALEKRLVALAAGANDPAEEEEGGRRRWRARGG